METINKGVAWLKAHPTVAIGGGLALIVIFYWLYGGSSSTSSTDATDAALINQQTSLAEAGLAASVQEKQLEGQASTASTYFQTAEQINAQNVNGAVAINQNNNATQVDIASLGADVQKAGISAQQAIAVDTLATQQTIANETIAATSAQIKEENALTAVDLVEHGVSHGPRLDTVNQILSGVGL